MAAPLLKITQLRPWSRLTLDGPINWHIHWKVVCKECFVPQKLPYLIKEVTKQKVIHNEGAGGSEGKFKVALSSHELDCRFILFCIHNVPSQYCISGFARHNLRNHNIPCQYCIPVFACQ